MLNPIVQVAAALVCMRTLKNAHVRILTQPAHSVKRLTPRKDGEIMQPEDESNSETKIFTIRNSLKRRHDPNDKVSKLLFACAPKSLRRLGELQVIEYTMERRKNGIYEEDEVVTYLKLEHADELPKELRDAMSFKFSAFDREVLYACLSEQADGNDVTTINAVYRAMTGASAKVRVHPEMKQAIQKSLSKLMFTEIKIDLTEACQKLGYGNGKPIILHSALLPGQYTDGAWVNHVHTTAIEFAGESAIFTCAKIKNAQILTYDVNLLNVELADGSILKNTPNTIVLKAYILRRILEIQGHKLTPTISFDDVFKKCGLTELPTDRQSKLKNLTKSMFDYWKKCKLIKNYTFTNTGREITAVTFKF